VSAQPVIELRDVSFSYDGDPVLEGVDLAIDERAFVTIVGPNGGGKTTLLKLILGLIHPSTGTVRVFGRPPVEARTRIGYVPQHSLADQSFPVRVLDVVLTGRLERGRVFGGYGPADRDAAIEALREVELCDHASRPFAALSGGLRQRTLIARALASQPDILLMDEPTANLDVMMEGELYALLRKTVVCVKRTIAVHPTGELTGDLISEMYGRDVRAVLHDPEHHRDGGC
jgi:zinc transport system ATP-binding protein